MSEVLPDLYYTEQHEWIKVDGDTGVIGITDFAQNALGDVTFVDLPAVDDEVKKGDEMIVIESTKAASDVYAPVSGKIVAINEAMDDEPELINSDPYDKGWLVKIELQDSSELKTLLSPEAYEQHTGSE